MALVLNSTVQPDCVKDWIVCGTVYGDMHLKDQSQEYSIVSRSRISIEWYMTLHAKKHYNGLINYMYTV